MQWPFFLIGYVVLVAAGAARKSHSDEYVSYVYPAEHFQHGSFPERFILTLGEDGPLYDVTDRFDIEPDSSEPKVISKRALSVLSRWRPFGNLGVRMNSIHKVPSRDSYKLSVSPGTDFVSAQTRGSTRPIGQPLRWGRKR